MPFINAGTDQPYATKKAFKEAVSSPEGVYVYSTGMFGPQFSGMIKNMPEDVTLQVVGPDPARNRKWYASVTRRGDTITVK